MISVIIPCYNSEDCVARAIESVLQQTYKDYEIILVDNNSSDNTVNILNEYAKKHPDLIRVFHEPKKGAPAARNKGFIEAKGEWIQNLDSDDELLPKRLEHMMALAENSCHGFIVGNFYKYETIDDKVHKSLVGADTDSLWSALLLSSLGNSCANFWNKAALIAADGWNENITASDDYELMFRMLKNGVSVSYSPYSDVIVHVRKNSMSRSTDVARTSEVLNASIQLRLEIKAYLKSKGMLTKELNRAADLYIYQRLTKYKNKVPLFVDKTLKEIDLNIPFTFKLKSCFKPKIKKIFGCGLKSMIGLKV